MQVFELPIETKASTGYTHKAILVASDLTAAGASQTINLLDSTAGDVITRCATRLVADFVSSDGTLTSTAVKIGHNDTTADDDAFMVSQELNAAGTVVRNKVNPSTTPFVFVAGTNASPKKIQAVFTGTSAKLLNTHTAGELHVFMTVADTAKI